VSLRPHLCNGSKILWQPRCSKCADAYQDFTVVVPNFPNGSRLEKSAGTLPSPTVSATKEDEVFAKVGALLAALLVAAVFTEPASASLKQVIIVDRLDTGMPGLFDVERGNPTEREVKGAKGDSRATDNSAKGYQSWPSRRFRQSRSLWNPSG
jgi:hypothetical protein